MSKLTEICILGLLTLSFCSCNDKPKESKITLTQRDTGTHTTEPKVFVKPGGSTDDGAVYLTVGSNSVDFIFGLNRCEYSFPCLNENKKIRLKWNLEQGECDYKNSLSKTFGLKKYPKKNDIFAEIEPQGDSALRITYLFKEFINEQNREGRENKEFKIDTLFPTMFKVHD